MQITSENDVATVHEACVCPNEETLGLFVERVLNTDRMESVALHLIGCENCKNKVTEIAEWLVSGKRLDVDDATPEERHAVCAAYDAVHAKYIQSLWESFYSVIQPTREYLAAADGQTPDQVQHETAMRSGFIHFASKTPRTHDNAWHAKLAIPMIVTDETHLRLQIFDSHEQPTKEGTLTFCGVDLDVKFGRAHMPIKQFRDNIKTAIIAFRPAGGIAIPGEPVRAYEAG